MEAEERQRTGCCCCCPASVSEEPPRRLAIKQSIENLRQLLDLTPRDEEGDADAAAAAAAAAEEEEGASGRVRTGLWSVLQPLLLPTSSLGDADPRREGGGEGGAGEGIVRVIMVARAWVVSLSPASVRVRGKREHASSRGERESERV